LKAFPDWARFASGTKRDVREIDGQEEEFERELRDTDYLFLHPNFVVTDGVYVDEHVAFDHVTPEWETFCRTTLQFSIPEYVR
jgi:hypothetical protein